MPENHEVAARRMAAFNARDVDGFVANEDPAMEFVVPGGITLKGREQVREYLQTFWTAFPDAHVQALSQVVSVDGVVTEGTITGTHAGILRTPNGEIPPTRRRVRLAQVVVLRFVDGLIASEHLYFDQMELMVQLGLVPAAAAQ